MNLHRTMIGWQIVIVWLNWMQSEMGLKTMKNGHLNVSSYTKSNLLFMLHYDFEILLVVDACGKLPSALMHGNYFDFGSFSQCFRIQRNGIDFKTKYCIGQLKFYAEELMPKSKVWPRLVNSPHSRTLHYSLIEINFMCGKYHFILHWFDID